MLGLSDTLALAFTLLAFAAAARRRWPLVVVALVLSVLAKETAFSGRSCARPHPAHAKSHQTRCDRGAGDRAERVGDVGQPRAERVRLDRLAVRGPAVGLDPQHRRPRGALARAPAGGHDRGRRLARARDAPHVRAYLLVLLALMAVLRADITESWVNTSRSVIAGLPLAAWAITANAITADA